MITPKPFLRLSTIVTHVAASLNNGPALGRYYHAVSQVAELIQHRMVRIRRKRGIVVNLGIVYPISGMPDVPIPVAHAQLIPHPAHTVESDWLSHDGSEWRGLNHGGVECSGAV